MANRKLLAWSWLTRRVYCVHCGELWATTMTHSDGCGVPSCEFCAAWAAAGFPENERAYAGDDYDMARGALPWLLRRRPSLRDLNQLDTAWWAAKDTKAREEAEQLLWEACDAALWPVRAAHALGALFGWGWRELDFWAGIGIEKIRIQVVRPQCTNCGERATTLLHDYPNRPTPTCDSCYAATTATPGGAR